MLQKEIKYDDFDGNPVVETRWFYISKGRLAKMVAEGGEDAFINSLTGIVKAAETKDAAAVLDGTRKLILLAAGVRTADGKGFLEDPGYEYTLSFETLLFELLQDPKQFEEFFWGVLPPEGRKIMQEMAEKEKDNNTVEAYLKMTDEEFRRLVPENERDWTKEQLVAGMARKNRLDKVA